MISRVNHHQKMSFSKCMSGDIFLLILLVAADQGAKWLSYLYLKGQPSVSLISGVLELHYQLKTRESRLECFREVYSFLPL
jgi:signal peptidase II